MRAAEAAAPPPLELWAGVECTVNRVGDCYHDQLRRNGHGDRVDDLDRFADLGVRTLRHPVLWERTAPAGLADADWSWADERLARLRMLGLRPIVGLVHHGSGPRHTSLVDASFAEGLAEFAGAVARRYPWVRHFTPVNEPLTTARFSGLYGHWYPHGRSFATFARALLVQCHATVRAMAAIREVTPEAQLVQTEDLGQTFSTPTLAYQAEHENHRRLLSLDLLCGRVDDQHPLAAALLAAGIPRAELEGLARAPCLPDLIGINYYVTSDRFLDERLERYPRWSHGGNGRHVYADVEAVRARQSRLGGHRGLLDLVWRRYGRPVALTEVHLGGPREEQLRWLAEAWQAAAQARADAIDVRAVTVWSLLGAFDWNRLVVREAGFYEPGVYDVRAPRPRPTALAAMLRALTAGQPYAHPVLDVPGWWRRPERRVYGWAPTDEGAAPPAAVFVPPRRAAPVLIIGATGTLGRAFARVCQARGLAHRLLARADMDIGDPASVTTALRELRPWAVVNAAGYVRVDDAERERERCRRENAEGPAVLAECCRASGVRLVTFSSDLVFDGGRTHPYVESDAPAPLCVYGASKAEAERAVLRIFPLALVIRTSAFFGPWDDHNFVTLTLRALSRGEAVRAACDAVVSPTYVPDLVHATLDLLVDGEGGLWHLANRGGVTWVELARRSAALARLDPERVEACEAQALGWRARRPSYSVLGSERGLLLPPLEESLARYLQDREPGRA